MRRSSMKTRSPETRRSSGAAARAARAVSGSGCEAKVEGEPHEAQGTQRIVGERTRRGHAQAARGEVGEPSERVDTGSPPASGSAIALT